MTDIDVKFSPGSDIARQVNDFFLPYIHVTFVHILFYFYQFQT